MIQTLLGCSHRITVSIHASSSKEINGRVSFMGMAGDGSRHLLEFICHPLTSLE